jgi:membrane-associated protease RseP (regulator of RpoE activity)
VTQPAPGSPELVVSLLAAGAGEPDVVAFLPERVDSVNRAIERFDYMPPLTRPSIGALLVDVLDVGGPVVGRVEANSAAAKLGLAAGDVIKTADGQAVPTVDALARVLAGKQPGTTVALQVLGRDGATSAKSLQVPVVATPRVISAGDQTLLFNPLAVALRTRLSTVSAEEQPIVRLNLAVALLRLGDYAGAREHLEGLQLPATGAVSTGTQQYLLGLVLEQLGDAAAAQRAFQAAAGTPALLTEDGPPVRLLVEQKLRGGSPGTPR